jgi:carboxypeptidase C (cathepsin A)
MRHIRNAQLALIIISGIPFTAWGQGGRAGRAQQQAAQQAAQQTAAPPQANAAGRGGRGGAGGTQGNSNEFYNYDTNAGVEAAIPDSPPIETHQKIVLNGETVAYTAWAGYMPLRNATTGQSQAHLFFTYYAKDGGGAARPVLFFMGGAPGVAATWQEFGGLGPKRMKWASDGGAGQAPYSWTENPHTLLNAADLVFVNPVGTAFSRPDTPAHGPSFWNTGADVASLGEFVRGFVNANNRRNSPIFLAAQDFGTGRAAGVASYLTEHNVPVSGVVLLSTALSADATAGDAQYITLLPSLVMAAWNHKKLTSDLAGMSAEQIAGRARQFASREYLHALYQGDRMSAEERNKVVADLAHLTGLSKAFLVNNDLRITTERFNAELLRDRHLTLSDSDSRVTGFQPAAGAGGRGRGGFFGFGQTPPIDFNLSNLAGGLETAYDAYLKSELNFKGAGVFYLSSGGVGTFASTGNDDTSLAGAFARNPNLRLFVAVNYYDLTAPFYAAEFTLAHLNVSPEVRAHNITIAHFDAGQMTYVDNKALAKLEGDLSTFLKEAAGPAGKQKIGSEGVAR